MSEKKNSPKEEKVTAPAEGGLAADEKEAYEGVIADMQATIDKLTAQKNNPNAKAEIEHGKKVYVLNIPKFRLGTKVCDVNDLEADSSLVKEVLALEGQQILIEKQD